MNTAQQKVIAAAGLLAVTVLPIAACSSNDTTSSASTVSATPSADAMATSAAPAPGGMADVAENLVGNGCESYAQQVPTGPGSVVGMAQDPVAVAASNNPMLKTLTQALSGKLNPNVNLVDTLNGNPGLTVFAPTDDAFAKIDPATIDKLKTDSDLLTKILTYHVVEGQLSPAQVAGQHKSLQGGSVDVTGSGAELKANDAALVCGGVKTANATVYMIDTVMMPPNG